MKASAVSTITKSLPIALSVLVNYSLLATLGYINLFLQKNTLNFLNGIRFFVFLIAIIISNQNTMLEGKKIQTNQSLSSYCSGRSYFIFDFVADCNAFEVHF